MRPKKENSTESSKMSIDSLAEFVAKERKKQRLSYRRLAEKGRIDHNYISRLEKSKQLGSPESLIGLARGLGFRPGELFDVLADEPPPPPNPPPPPDNELLKVVIGAVIEYLKNTDNLAELQELISAMASPYDKRYGAVQPVVEDVSKEMGKGRKDISKPRSFKKKEPPPQKQPPPGKAANEQLIQDTTVDNPD